MNTSLNVKVEDSTLMVLGHDASLFLLETTVDRLLVHPSGGSSAEQKPPEKMSLAFGLPSQ